MYSGASLPGRRYGVPRKARSLGDSITRPPRAKERRLASTPAVPDPLPGSPNYAERFRCIGPACEDTCCEGWAVPIDRATFDKYQGLPESPLRILIDTCIVPKQTEAVTATKDSDANVKADSPAKPGATSEPNPALFAAIRMNQQNQCPLLSVDHLCRIHSELGESYLSYTCATYPRIVTSIDGAQETSLALSCPEAARLVLLTPALLKAGLPGAVPDTRSPAPDAAESPQDDSPQACFRAIRQAALTVILNRAYPLWQRMFLLNVFCRRLDSIAREQPRRSIPAFLADFHAAVTSGAPRASMETLPADRNAQLDVVLRLAGLMLQKSNVRPRFVECIQAFTKGIGNGPGATLDSLAAHSAFANDHFFVPFISQHPHILENYLANAILRRQFPLGKEGLRPGAQIEAAREFSMLAAQFVLMRGLLIGVAGFHGADFSAAHVVHTVQAASKHFDHHPEFPSLSHSLLVDSAMNDTRGLAILLRNPEAVPAGDGASPRAAQRPDRASADGKSDAVREPVPLPVPAQRLRARPE
jgi:lysine-N-methylase